MTTPRIEELKDYKEPTQLNGTDYYRFPVNKVEHIITKARQAGIDEAVEVLKNSKRKVKPFLDKDIGYNEALDDTIKALQDKK